MADTMTPAENATQRAPVPPQEDKKKMSRLESYNQAYMLSETKVQKLLGHVEEQQAALQSCNDPRAARKLTAELMKTMGEATKATRETGRNLEAYLREEKAEERSKARAEAWGRLVLAVKNAVHRGFEAVFPKIPQDMQGPSREYVTGLEKALENIRDDLSRVTSERDALVAEKTAREQAQKTEQAVAAKDVISPVKAPDMVPAGVSNPVPPKHLAPNVDTLPGASPSVSSGDPRVDKVVDKFSESAKGASMENLHASLKDQQAGASGRGIKQPYDKGIGDPPSPSAGLKLGQAVKKKAEELGQSAKEHGVDIGDDGRKAQQAVIDSADRLDTSIEAAKAAPAAEVARAWTDVVKSAHNMTAAVGNYGKHVMAKAVEKGDKVRSILGEKVRSMFKANKQAVEQSVPAAELAKVRAQSADQAKQIANLQAQMAELLTANRIQAAKLQPAGLEKASMVQGLLEDGVSTDKLKDLATPAENIKLFTGRAHKVGEGVALVDEKGKLVLLDKVTAEKLEHIRNRDEVSISRKDPQSEFGFRNRTIEQALGQGKERE